MKTYYVDTSDLAQSILPVDPDFLVNLLPKNFQFTRDMTNQRYIVRCDERPKDSKLFNILWKEQEENRKEPKGSKD